MSRLVRHLLLAIVLGITAGSIFGPRIAPVGEVGMLTIRVLKALATPLLFFGVADTFCKTRIAPRDGARLIGFSLLNASVALIISLSLLHLVPLERILDFNEIRAHLPTGASAPLATVPLTPKLLDTLDPSKSVISVVLFAILIGLAIRRISPNPKSRIPRLFEAAYRVIHRVLSWVVLFIPIAVFCVLAKIVGSSGLALFPTLGVFIGLVVLGMFLQVGVYYSALLRFFGYSPGSFFRDGSAPLLTAFSTGSSLATLPVTLETLQNKGKIPEKYARLAAAIGTNLNHDGILLYEAMAALFVARIYGIPLSLGDQATIGATSVLAAIGIAGVPEAGLITLSLVLHAAGLPLESVALLLPIDWLIGRLRATTNVASDMMVAHALNRLSNPR